METLDCLKTRRSIRFYKNIPVPPIILRQIFESAEHAPSAKNSRPWEYLLLEGDEKNAICDIALDEEPRRLSPYKVEDTETKRLTNIASIEFIRQAPILVLVFNKAPFTVSEANVINDISPASLMAHSIELQGVSAFMHSVVLAAHDLGLGACWVADLNFCRGSISRYLNIPFDLVGGITLGYPDQLVPEKQVSFDSEKIKFWKKP